MNVWLQIEHHLISPLPCSADPHTKGVVFPVSSSQNGHQDSYSSALTDSPSFKTEQSENAERGTCPSIRNEQKSMKYGDSQLALAVKNPLDSTGAIRDPCLIPGSGRFPGGGHGNPLQYSCLKNPTDRGVWQATVRGVTKSSTWLKELSMQAHTMHMSGFKRSGKEEWDWKLGSLGSLQMSLSDCQHRGTQKPTTWFESCSLLWLLVTATITTICILSVWLWAHYN